MKFILLIFVFSKILQKISFITLMKRVISFVYVPILCFGFQSTLLRREWLYAVRIYLQILCISIHTPTKGVTNHFDGRICIFKNFNPHSHEGSDSASTFKRPTKPNFNPHSHEGSDKLCDVSYFSFYDFNPHSHEGSVEPLSTCFRCLQKFQSTLPRREWPSQALPLGYPLSISIHTPTKGVTQKPYVLYGTKAISIHTPTKGVTISMSHQT